MRRSIYIAFIILTANLALAGTTSKLTAVQVTALTSQDGKEDRSVLRFDLPSSWRNQNVDYAAIELQFVVPDDSAKGYLAMVYPVHTEISSQPSWSVTESLPDSLGVPVFVTAKSGYRARVILTTLMQRWAKGRIECTGFVVISAQGGTRRATLAEAKGGALPQLEARLASR